MLRLILALTVLSTVMLIVAAVFFCTPSEFDLLDRRAMGMFQVGKTAEARALWKQAAGKFTGSAKAHLRYGTALAVDGQFAAAETHLRRSLSIAPNEPDAHRELGICYLRQGKLDDAERELKRTLELASWFPEAHFYLGMVYEKRNKPELARDQYVMELNENAQCTFAWAKILREVAK